MIRPVALAIVLALVGCQSADVQRAQPTLTIPAAWRADVGPASPVEGVWWRNFHDSTLNQYVDQALRYNSDVLIARERVNEYQARAYAADSSLFPSLDASLTGTRARTQSAATGLPIHSTLYKGGLTASYDVDIWGANRSAANAAGASLEAQKAAAAAANLSVASSVAVGYVTLLSLDEQLRVTQQTLTSREDAWRLAKRQFETGYTSRLELMQADSELRSTRAQIDQRGRLNVNTDKNVWRCNRCGTAGGMLALYARYNCTGNADAYREICEALGRYTPRPRVNDCIGIKPEQNARATPQEIHQTYSLLLSMLPLTPTHKAHLLSPRRGLTEEQVARFGFKSTPPAFLCRSYAERLRRQGCTLQGVPGFYQDDTGRWTINFGSRTAGILLPAVGMDGLICGMQIRLDTPLRRRDDPPGKSGAKYIWLSSIGKPHGVTSGSPLHFVGEPFAKTVYVTEGLLKADIAHCLTGRSFVAVAGVNSLNGLESALRCMAQNGTKLVVEAYDMDKLENEYVAEAAEKVQQIAHTAGLQSTSLVWNTAYKGIDDWQLALRQEETKEKAA